MGLIETLHTCACEVAAGGRGRVGRRRQRVGISTVARTKVRTLAGDGVLVAEIASGGIVDGGGVLVFVARPGGAYQYGHVIQCARGLEYSHHALELIHNCCTSGEHG